ncbi:PPK2 family polyphosphate kinase [Nocardioides marmorisolisilvae]|uniref:Polyphosphate kinase 2 family protein n=1 Tax=Nocardioides marmorisolisilvae TaxID=1542737 RepID=A0A3N0DUH3_9ACTN|nr:PPK2 family polyphosphate kinase [Nocardioides marmorisolisilvae]RNL79136.1 polyphosphate kinase 2 family protein [Nocardioides marmorisolisilvae]
MALRDELRFRGSLADHPTDGTPGFDGGKKDAEKELPELGPEMADLQEKLFAHGYTEGKQRLLLVLQGMDTSGKGGILSHAVGLLDPGGMHLKSFKKPTREELSHDFLWRIEREVPAAGEIGIFDRSHYEDVLVVKVHQLTDAPEIERRYDAINAFEKNLVDSGTVIVKCMLHISKETQKERLLARLDDPTKQWKFKPEDVDERGYWDDYQKAYEIALERCNTDHAPWFVIPSDRKWYRNWAIGRLLRDHLAAMNLDWPAPDYDIAEQRARLEDEK